MSTADHRPVVAPPRPAGIALGAALAGVVMLSSGCGVPTTDVIAAGPAPSGIVAAGTGAGTASTPLPSATPSTVRVYLVRDGALHAARRPSPPGPESPEPAAAVSRILTALLSGPTPQERRAGVTTEVPAGTEVSFVDVRDARTHIRVQLNLSATDLSPVAATQISCTLAGNVVPEIAALTRAVRLQGDDGRPLDLPACLPRALPTRPS